MRHRLASRLLRLALAALAASVGTVVAAGASAAEAHDHQRAADTVFVNGKVLLYGKHDRWADAVAVDRGVISYVGEDRGARKLVGPRTRVVDLHGKTLMPGIIDGHAHGSDYRACDMEYIGGTLERILGKLKECLLRDDQADLLHTNSLLIAATVDFTSLPPGSRLTRQVLDRLSAAPGDDEFGTGTTRPILVVHHGGHSYSTNSQAIVNAGLDENTPDPPTGFIGRDANGVPTGEFSDFWADFGLEPPPPPDSVYTSRVENVTEASHKGITSYLRPGGSIDDLAIWKRVADDGLLTVRVNQALSAQEVRGEDDPARIRAFIDTLNAARRTYDGYTSPSSPGELDVDTVKIFCDGVQTYPFQTAAMLQPYNVNVGTPEAPVWVPGRSRGEDPSCDDAVPGFLALDKNHWSMHLHAIGNRATRVGLDNFALARRVNGVWDSRHTITHLSFVAPSDMPRFGKLRVVASMSMQWAGRSIFTVDLTQGYLSPDVYNTWFSARSLQEGGAVLAGGSDWPVERLLPFRQIEVAVTRELNPARDLEYAVYTGQLIPSEAISRLDSLKMHTQGGAYQLHLNAGEIKKGKLADLIVVDRNPMTVPARDIGSTQVLMTMLGGKVVWDDPDTGI